MKKGFYSGHIFLVLLCAGSVSPISAGNDFSDQTRYEKELIANGVLLAQEILKKVSFYWKTEDAGFLVDREPTVFINQLREKVRILVQGKFLGTVDLDQVKNLQKAIMAFEEAIAFEIEKQFKEAEIKELGAPVEFSEELVGKWAVAPVISLLAEQEIGEVQGAPLASRGYQGAIRRRPLVALKPVMNYSGKRERPVVPRKPQLTDDQRQYYGI